MNAPARSEISLDPELHESGSVPRRLPAGVSKFLLPTVLIVAVLVVWQLWVTLADVKPYILPGPISIVGEIIDKWPRELGADSWATLLEAIIGFIGGCFVGFALAVCITYSATLERMFYPLLVAAQATPKIAVAPLFLLWFGYGIVPKVIITILLVFFPMVINSAQGLQSVDGSLLDLLRSVDARKRDVFFKVLLPHSLPHVVAGMKISITLAVIGAVVSEWVSASKGLGYRVLYAQSQLATTEAFAAIGLLVVMGIVLFGAVWLFGRLITPWQTNSGLGRSGTGSW